MRAFAQNKPLTDAELDHLRDFLRNCKGSNAMKVEALDGFFAALIAGPATVMPSEYYREVFGGEIADTCMFVSIDEANEIFGLLMRHWNNIAGKLFKGEVYVPLLLDAKDGIVLGNDWARGFMHGTGLRHDDWAALVNDEEHGGCLVPMMMLCHEHDPDPEMRPEPISPEKREKVIALMAVGLLRAYSYFREHREGYTDTPFTSESPRNVSKVGRNDLCPCGSGKKYKRCCGGATVH